MRENFTCPAGEALPGGDKAPKRCAFCIAERVLRHRFLQHDSCRIDADIQDTAERAQIVTTRRAAASAGIAEQILACQRGRKRRCVVRVAVAIDTPDRIVRQRTIVVAQVRDQRVLPAKDLTSQFDGSGRIDAICRGFDRNQKYGRHHVYLEGGPIRGARHQWIRIVVETLGTPFASSANNM
ncbi:hypothetical protein OKW41_004973 [Paraburkholderia sp. UCT70]|uniref:hypothetical protein n=1 Tax=Paraburkholderia sp. UCT70 TaxID=2991068 RepID=UPI003D1CB2FE